MDSWCLPLPLFPFYFPLLWDESDLCAEVIHYVCFKLNHDWVHFSNKSRETDWENLNMPNSVNNSPLCLVMLLAWGRIFVLNSYFFPQNCLHQCLIMTMWQNVFEFFANLLKKQSAFLEYCNNHNMHKLVFDLLIWGFLLCYNGFCSFWTPWYANSCFIYQRLGRRKLISKNWLVGCITNPSLVKTSCHLSCGFL